MAASAQLLLGDPSGLWARTAPLCDVIAAVCDGHAERGPEGRVVTFVRLPVAAVLIFDEAMARDLGGRVAVRGGELVETEDDGV